LQELFCLTFEFLEHHTVAILGMTGFDASLKDDRVPVEPERGLKVSADGAGHHQLDVAAGATGSVVARPMGTLLPSRRSSIWTWAV